MAENYFGITDKGRQRENNEDTFIAEAVLNKYIMACVIDGVGGYEGGEIAASLAKQSILEYFSVPSGDVITMMKEAIVSANEKIFSEKSKNPQYENMACVLTIAIVDQENKKFYYSHVGDTRLYLLRDNTLVKVTKDHSFVGLLEDSGRLTERAAMDHPKRNEINKALGFDGKLQLNSDYIETGESPFLPGDAILLCSDGLSDMIGSNEMTSVLLSDESLEEKGRGLIDSANVAGGKDNITVVLVQNTNKPLKQKATRPVVVKKKAVQKKDEVTRAENTVAPGKNLYIKKRNNAPLIILSFLCLAFLAAFFWALMRKPDPAIVPAQPTEPVQTLTGNKLQEAINKTTGDTLVLEDSIFAGDILLGDTVFIDKEFLYIKANGNKSFTGDSSYSGPAFFLSPSCKTVVFDSLSFQNFDIGIIAGRADVQLKNVRFQDCRLPVQYQFTFGNDEYINRMIKVGSFKTDSLPNNR